MSFDFATASHAAAKKFIAEQIATNDEWLFRGLLAIYNRQTEDERQSEETKHDNGMGFSGRDAEFGSKMAQQLIEFQQGKSQFRRPFSPKQLEAVRRIMKRYCGQLAKVAKATAKAKKLQAA